MSDPKLEITYSHDKPFRERVFEHGKWWICTNCTNVNGSSRYVATYRISAYQDRDTVPYNEQ